MAFKKIKRTSTSYDNIESLFRDLPRSSEIKSLYNYQADVIRNYEKAGVNNPNVTIELPTGSGKTLIGLLIGEFNRRVHGRKVVYLCPTRQLVNQVVEGAKSKYGIKAVGFTGRKSFYSADDKFAYNNSDAIAVTTYSSLFNTHPWFSEPDLVIIDDAHTAENYISSNWSVLIKRSEHINAYNAFVEVIKDSLNYSIYKRLIKQDAENIDYNTIEKLSNKVLFDKKEQIYETLSVYLDDHQELRWPWSMIRENIEGCQIYYSWKEILIRPFIPPALKNEPFSYAKQRIFMSATLGEGGDLQRITGIKKFHEIPIPEGWDTQGMGRRFFMFPNLKLEQSEIGELMSNLLERNNRTVILVSSDDQVQNFRSELKLHHPEIEFFTANDIEESKEQFVKSDNAAIVLANRFDGIDFAEDQSRLLFLVGIPYASNIQEKFLQSRMSASIIFNDRNKTRLIQAIGRCTRSPNDYSAICVLGEKDLSDWLTIKSKYKYLHPELQAEINFGIENSKEATKDDFIDNYEMFINQTEDWHEANNSIIEDREHNTQESFDGASELEKSARLEVDYQYKLWDRDYKACYDISIEILACLDGGNALRGYRAYWNYQAGSIAYYIYKETGEKIFHDKHKEFYDKMSRICPSATWMRNISPVTGEEMAFDDLLIWNIEQLQHYIQEININNSHKYLKYIKQVEEFITTGDLENLTLHIGKLLGFRADNPSSDGAPDPYWISSDEFVFVFENKMYETEDGDIAVEHIRQAEMHKNWIKSNVLDLSKEVTIIPVIITNRSKTVKAGFDVAKDLMYWSYNEFVIFSRSVLNQVKLFPQYYSGGIDDNWKDYAANTYSENHFSPKNLVKLLRKVNEGL